MSRMNKTVCRHFSIAMFGLALSAPAQTKTCNVQAIQYKGWNAQQISNAWVKLTLVPQLGGRLMQVVFDGHSYLFVNPQFEGKYISPEEAAGKWINYGGDKIWPMPEGDKDEQHWMLESSTLDDAPYAFKVIEQSAHCTVELAGPTDEKTGIQYTRQISIDADSPAIHFHAIMRNATAHTLRWSMQSVSQYDLSSAKHTGEHNRDFWAYTPVRSDPAYLEGFHVRSGLADDPSFSIENDLFRLHWMYLQNEVWIDSPGGWLAVADGESGFGMIERFDFDPVATYPGKASVIFYKNGPSIQFNDAGQPTLSAHKSLETPYYMEAEINSPLITLKAGATYAMDTTWFPVRTSAAIQQITEAGIVIRRLHAVIDKSELKLTGSFSVVVPGQLQLRVFNANGRDVKHISLDTVIPSQPVTLNRTVPVDFLVSRVSLHLLDENGKDWGLLDEFTTKHSGGEQ